MSLVCRPALGPVQSPLPPHPAALGWREQNRTPVLTALPWARLGWVAVPTRSLVSTQAACLVPSFCTSCRPQMAEPAWMSFPFPRWILR